MAAPAHATVVRLQIWQRNWGQHDEIKSWDQGQTNEGVIRRNKQTKWSSQDSRWSCHASDVVTSTHGIISAQEFRSRSSQDDAGKYHTEAVKNRGGSTYPRASQNTKAIRDGPQHRPFGTCGLQVELRRGPRVAEKTQGIPVYAFD